MHPFLGGVRSLYLLLSTRLVSISGSNPDGCTKFMSDDRWKTMFKVISRYVDDGDMGSRFLYDVINVYNDNVVATYREQRYAVKQARRRYKKLVKLMESHFTSKT